MLTDRFRQFLYLMPVGNVTGQRESLAAIQAELSAGRIQFVLAARRDHHPVSLPSKRLRQSPAQTAASAGDQNDFPLHRHQGDN
jgi:hypothetical protein